MLYDTTATDACFVQGRAPADINEILEWARDRLSLNGTPPWRLISARRKFGKTLFEIEEKTPAGTRRLIGKLGKTERAQTLHRALNLLRDNGFRPPSKFIVPESLACIPERGFVLLEKASGVQASDLMRKTVGAVYDRPGAHRAPLQPEQDCRSAAAHSAEWLARLHRSNVRAPSATSSLDVVSQWASELAAAVPGEAKRIDAIAEAVRRDFAQPAAATVPCHGDFHPMNIFIAPGNVIIGIDLDKFCEREPESDIGYFLSQTAAFDFFENASFDFTADARRAFVETYEAETGRPIRRGRAAMYMAMAFLKNLHFEIVLLETGRTERVDPWLSAATSAINDQDLYLSP